MILSNHDAECSPASRRGTVNCRHWRTRSHRHAEIPATRYTRAIDASSVSIVRDPNKCILCGRCVQVCSEIQTVNALTLNQRGFDTTIATAFKRGHGEQRVRELRPVHGLLPCGRPVRGEPHRSVWKALMIRINTCRSGGAAIRAQLGEEFGMPAGTLVSGKLHAALRRMKFDAVFDTNFTADLTILEEGTEVVEAIKAGKRLP